MGEPRSNDPDFVPSLRLLVEREQYCQVDIGLMLGVCRERVRQWCIKYGIEYPENTPRGLRAYRVWDDSLNRFVPQRRVLVKKEIASKQKLVRREKSWEKLKQRRVLMVAVIIELQKKLGRSPSLPEMARVVVGYPVPRNRAGPLLIAQWGGPRSTKKKYGEFRAALSTAGVRPRLAGGSGHIGPRSPRKGGQRILCKRGHLLAETRDKYNRCAVCKRWRSKASDALHKGRPIPPVPLVLRPDSQA